MASIEPITARVAIQGHNSETNAPCSGSVTVVVTGSATLDDILQAAMDYVDEGGIRWGAHGSKACIADIASLDGVSIGAIPDPAVYLTGEEHNPGE